MEQTDVIDLLPDLAAYLKAVSNYPESECLELAAAFFKYHPRYVIAAPDPAHTPA